MKKLLIIFALILITTTANADNIVVVDVQKIMQESKAANGIREQIKEKRDSYQKEITEEEDKLRGEEKKLSEQRSILSPEAFKDKREEFKEKLIKVQRDVQVKRSKLDTTLNESIAQVQQAIFDIIDELATEKKFQIAIPTSQILYAENSMNITDEVLKRLNNKLPKVKLKDE